MPRPPSRTHRTPPPCGVPPAKRPLRPPYRSPRRPTADRLSFLPPHRLRCSPRRRGSRFLVSTSSPGGVVVCDPLHRRCVRIPSIPDGLTSDIRRICRRLHFDYFLAPSAGDGEEGEDSSFGVVCRAWTRDVSMVAVFVFSSSAGSWRAVTIDGYRPRFTLCRRQYAHGCFYWFTSLRGKSLMLNARDMEISIVEFPQSCFGIGQHAIVEAGEGRLGLFTIGDCNLDLHSKAIGAGGIAGANEWRHDKTIPLLPRYKWDIINAAEGFLLLKGFPLDHYPPRWIPTEIPCFTLELKTLLLKRLCMLHLGVVCDALLLYRSFPPPLSLPSI